MSHGNHKSKKIFFLVFDLGTTNLKLGLFKNTKLLTTKTIKVAPFISSQEINVPLLQEKFIQGIKSFWQRTGRVPLTVIAGIGIGHGLTLYNKQGGKFEKSFTYSNLEASNEAKKLKKISQKVYQDRGSPPASSYSPEQAALRNKKNQLRNYLLYSSVYPLLGTMSCQPLKITKTALSHLGFLNLRSLALSEFMMGFAGLNSKNFAGVSESSEVGQVDKEACQQWGLPKNWAGRVKLMDLGLDGLAIHYLINQPQIGSLKVESTAVVRAETQSPILENIRNGQIPVTWSYFLENNRFIWGSATNAGGITIQDQLDRNFDYSKYNSLLSQKLQKEGVPPLEKVGIGLPFSRGERAPGWAGKRPSGMRGKRPKEIVWKFYLWEEAITFNLKQVIEIMKKVAQEKNIGFPEKFVTTGAVQSSPLLAKMVSSINEINLMQIRNLQPNLLAAANKVLRLLKRETIPLEQKRLYSGKEIYFMNQEQFSQRYHFYLKNYMVRSGE